MSNEIHFIPPHLATQANMLLGKLVLDSDDRSLVLRFIEQVHAIGYESGYIRALGDESYRMTAERDHEKAAAKETQS